MAITAHASNSGTTSTTNPVLNFGFTAAAGDLVLMGCGSDSGITGHTHGGSWSELDEQTASGVRGSIAQLIAAGGETTDSVTGSGTADRWEAAYVRIPAGEWHGTTPPEIVASTTGTSAAPDPPAITPSWGNEPGTIFVTFVITDDSVDVAINSYPTDYDAAQIDSSATTSSANVGAAVRADGAHSHPENPGAYGLSASEAWRAWTIAVRGPASGDQSVEPAVLAMTLTPVAPTRIDQDASPATIAMALGLAAPQVDLAAALATLATSLAPIGFTRVDQDAALGTLAMPLSPVVPAIGQMVDVDVIAMPLATLAPAFEHHVDPAAIAVALTAIAPMVVAEQQVDIGTASSPLVAVTLERIDLEAALGTINVLLTAIAPITIDQDVAPGTVGLALTPQTPLRVDLELAVSTQGVVLTPIAFTRIDQDLALGSIAVTLTPVGPIVQDDAGLTVGADTIGMSLQAIAPASVDQQVDPDTLTVSLTLLPPSVDATSEVGIPTLELTLTPQADLRLDQEVLTSAIAMALEAIAPELAGVIGLDPIVLALTPLSLEVTVIGVTATGSLRMTSVQLRMGSQASTMAGEERMSPGAPMRPGDPTTRPD